MGLQDEAERLVALIQDFRSFDGVAVTPDTVLRWTYQFDADYREQLLSHMCILLARHYITSSQAKSYLLMMLESDKLTGGDPRRYWSSTHLIGNQLKGSSQRYLAEMFAALAREKFGQLFQFAGPLAERAFYLDDFVFSGGRVKEDFLRWADIKTTYGSGRFHIDFGFFGVHALGEYFFDNLFREKSSSSSVKFTYKMWRIRTYENRRARRDSSSVLWPSVTAGSLGHPQFDVASPVLRSPPGGVDGVWSEADRSFLERQLLEAGCRIANSIATRQPSWRPLGFYNFGYGFGAICSSYLNCPNNAPLALWWTAKTQGIPQGWNALLPRRAND